MWRFRFTLRHTDTGSYSEIFSSAADSTQFADEAFKQGWATFYDGGYSKTFEVVRCIVYSTLS